jgi:hypothetical protein
MSASNSSVPTASSSSKQQSPKTEAEYAAILASVSENLQDCLARMATERPEDAHLFLAEQLKLLSEMQEKSRNVHAWDMAG